MLNTIADKLNAEGFKCEVISEGGYDDAVEFKDIPDIDISGDYTLVVVTRTMPLASGSYAFRQIFADTPDQAVKMFHKMRRLS